MIYIFVIAFAARNIHFIVITVLTSPSHSKCSLHAIRTFATTNTWCILTAPRVSHNNENHTPHEEPRKFISEHLLMSVFLFLVLVECVCVCFGYSFVIFSYDSIETRKEPKVSRNENTKQLYILLVWFVVSYDWLIGRKQSTKGRKEGRYYMNLCILYVLYLWQRKSETVVWALPNYVRMASTSTTLWVIQ